MNLNPIFDEFFHEFFGIPEKSESNKIFETWLDDNYPPEEGKEESTA